MNSSSIGPNEIKADGFTVLAQGGGENALFEYARLSDFLFDQLNVSSIVLIHGLGGHPRDTWTYRNKTTGNVSDDSKYGLRKVFKHKKRNTDHLEVPRGKEEDLYWPGELLAKDFKDARIMTYGYDSQIARSIGSAANQNTISSHGEFAPS
ncbi:hypothetical protein B0A49_13708 [Cryomyces minteri]|uniref:Uncharacterized protein n=1 Tax=Cryomyces minteri TaxID=331657 RepID=A0A4U0VY67_9PEZI|nr:hypothetical protein B0A49_13593 [Cryomyces minteri]TKA54731.1 hypothetical protein B0A49_13708 [Cryomyces minteri]